MFSQSKGLKAIPGLAQLVARAAFPKGNLVVRMRDELGTVYSEEQFSAFFRSGATPPCRP